MIFLVICALIGLVAYCYNKIKEPEPIFGIYSRPGKWYPVKYVLFLLMFYYRKVDVAHTRRNCAFVCGVKVLTMRMDMTLLSFRMPSFKTQWTGQVTDDEPKPKTRAGQGVKSHNNPEEMDVAQPLSDHAKAFDAAFFISANSEGFYVAAGCERRQMGIIGGLFYIVIPGKGVLCSAKIPDTILFGAKIKEFGAEGLLLTPVEPMKRWNVSYNGKMWYQSDPNIMLDVSFEGEWTATSKYFDYDTDLNPKVIARSIAREPWSSQYFENLKVAHQSHYEQFGIMKAKFTVDKENYELNMDSFRDHSYGHKRDWELMHRYAFHHIFLADGHKISIGVICQPCTATLFEVGLLYSPEHGINYPIDWCDLELYKHGEHGTPPTDYAFQFKAAEKIYTVQVDVVHQSQHFVGSHWDARMVERFAKFTVNGVKGWGISEFHYNNKSGRPESKSKLDPDWYQILKNN